MSNTLMKSLIRRALLTIQSPNPTWRCYCSLPSSCSSSPANNKLFVGGPWFTSLSIFNHTNVTSNCFESPTFGLLLFWWFLSLQVCHGQWTRNPWKMLSLLLARFLKVSPSTSFTGVKSKIAHFYICHSTDTCSMKSPSDYGMWMLCFRLQNTFSPAPSLAFGFISTWPYLLVGAWIALSVNLTTRFRWLNICLFLLLGSYKSAFYNSGL